jgi:hypothetical protein
MKEELGIVRMIIRRRKNGNYHTETLFTHFYGKEGFATLLTHTPRIDGWNWTRKGDWGNGKEKGWDWKDAVATLG